MPFFILSIILQVLFVLHILKTGRNTTWIWVVVMLPVAGAIAYFIMEIMPDFMAGRWGWKVKRSLRDTLSPNRDIQVAERDFSVTDTVSHSARLAGEYLQKERFAQAQDLYKKCLTGLYTHDPDLLYGLAQAQWGLQHVEQARSTLDQLIAENPTYKNADAHLLYARIVEALGEVSRAHEEYRVLAEYYPGPEAAYRYALFLQQQGKPEVARQQLESILHASRTAGSAYNRINEQWIKAAKQTHKQLTTNP